MVSVDAGVVERNVIVALVTGLVVGLAAMYALSQSIPGLARTVTTTVTVPTTVTKLAVTTVTETTVTTATLSAPKFTLVFLTRQVEMNQTRIVKTIFDVDARVEPYGYKWVLRLESSTESGFGGFWRTDIVATLDTRNNVLEIDIPVTNVAVKVVVRGVQGQVLAAGEAFIQSGIIRVPLKWVRQGEPAYVEVTVAMRG